MKQRATLLILITAVLMLLSCAKDKPYEEVQKAPELTKISETIDTDATFLYMPSTLDVPKDVTSVDAFFPGIEKLVKLRLTEHNLEIYEIYEDERFRDNEMNNSPVISIPVTYKEFQCAENSQGECSNREEENTKIDWSQKSFFKPDFVNMRIHENNFVDFFIDKSCFQETGIRLVDYTMNKEVIHIRLEKTFKTVAVGRCFKGIKNLSATSFKIRFMYSLVKLDKLASKDYEPVTYPEADRDRFGYFATTTSKTDMVYDESNVKTTYYLNRFNPKKKEIAFYLSDTFNKSQNKLFKDATYQSIENVNLGLKMADAGIQLVLKEPKAGVAVGDLRYNVINLVDEPVGNGLAGMAPSFTNPLTGEIVSTFVNMYGGSMKQAAQWTYMAMVDLSESRAKTLGGSGSNEDSVSGSPSYVLEVAGKSKRDDSFIRKILADFKMSAIVSESNNSTIVDVARIAKIKQPEERLFARRSLERSKIGKEDVTKIENDEYEEYLRKLAKHNADPIEMVNHTAYARSEFKGIRDIDGIVKKDGSLVPWKKLSQDQKIKVLDLIVPKLYIQTLVHEIGHSVGLRHNFMGSADKDNFFSEEEAKALGMETVPTYSSIMDYDASSLNDLSYFGKYDIAALRFGYARKVEKWDGGLIEIAKTLSAFDDAIDLKSYKYCTDHEVGLSPLCGRHDEGTTLEEIVNFHYNNYNDFYKYRNYRNGRNDFNSADIYGSVSARDRMFRAVRRIYEDVERLPSYGLENGCDEKMREIYPGFCLMLDDEVAASKTIGQMFLEILKTPDLTCAFALEESQDKVVRLVSYRTLLEQILKTVGKQKLGHVPKDCFAAGKFIKLQDNKTKRPLVVVGQVGRMFLGVSEIDPRFAGKQGALAIRGIWHDKILAMKYLTKRYLGFSAVEQYKGSLIDHQDVREELTNLIEHLVFGNPLSNPLPIRKKDGTRIETDLEYKLIGNEYIIPEQPTTRVAKMLGLPIYDNIHLTKVLLTTIVKANATEDIILGPKSKQLAEGFGVYKKDVADGFTNPTMRVLYTPDGNYGATQGNQIATILIDSINNERILDMIGREKVQSIYQSVKSANEAESLAVETFESFNEDQKTVSILKIQEVEKIKSLQGSENELDLDYFTQMFSQEDMANIAFRAYKLAADQLDKVLDYAKLIESSRLEIPGNATPHQRMLYDGIISPMLVEGYLNIRTDPSGRPVSSLRMLNEEFYSILELLPAL